MSIINITKNSQVTGVIFGTSKWDIITVYPTVTVNVTIDGLGGGDTIFALGNGTDTVVYHSNDLAYVGGLGNDILDIKDVYSAGATIDLRGYVHHGGPLVTGFSKLDLTDGGHNTAAHTLLIDAQGVDNFTDNPKGTHNMIVDAGQKDTISMGTGWTQITSFGHPAIIGGNYYHEYTQTILEGCQKETMFLYVENRAPVAVADSNAVGISTPSASGNVLSNDTDVDPGDKAHLQVTQVDGLASNVGIAVADPNNDGYGSLTINANGSYTYTLNTAGAYEELALGKVVHEVFTYQVTDGFGGYSSTIVTINVTGADVPDVVHSSNLIASATEYTPVSIDATALFTHDDTDDALSYSLVGSLPAGLQFDASTGLITGTITDDGLIGAQTIMIKATSTDPNGPNSATATITLNVHDAVDNGIGLIANTTDATVTEGIAITPIETAAAFSHTGVESDDALNYKSADLAALGLSIDPVTGEITGTVPASVTPGMYTINVIAYNADPNNAGDPTKTDTFTITVNPAIQAKPDSFSDYDTVSSSQDNKGNLLTNDTIIAGTVVSTAASTDAGGLVTLPGALGAVGSLVVTAVAGPLPAGVVAEFSITPTGALLTHEPGVMAADLKVYANGEVDLIKNNAFDFLPDGQSLTMNFSYTDQVGAATSSSTFTITIDGTDNNDVIVGTGGSSLTGGKDNDLIIGSGAAGGDAAKYTADILGGPKNPDGNTIVRDYVNGPAVDSAAEFAVAQVAAAGLLVNYDLSLVNTGIADTTGIKIDGVHDGAVDGTDTIKADVSSAFNQIYAATANLTSTVDLIMFGDPHTYQLYNGTEAVNNEEWITAIAPGAGQEGALMIGGTYSFSDVKSYYVIEGNAGNDVLVGGKSTSTAASYGYFLLGEGGSNVLIGGDNLGSNDYYVCATDNFDVIRYGVYGNSILTGGSNLGTGGYYMVGAEGNDVLTAGVNASTNAFDLYYLSGGGGTNLFVSNSGNHVFDGTNGVDGARLPDGTLAGQININNVDANDTAQYHHDILGGVAPGDVRTFLTSATPTLSQIFSVSSAVAAGALLNYNLTLVAAGADTFANKGGILVDAKVAGDGHDLLVGDTTNAGANSTAPVSSIPNIAFDTAADLSGTNYSYELFNTPLSFATGGLSAAAGNSILLGGTATGPLVILAVSSGDNILIGGDENSSGGFYFMYGGTGNDILIGGANNMLGTSYDLEGGGGNNILVGSLINHWVYSLVGGTGNDILFAGMSAVGGEYLYIAGTGASETLSFLNVTAGVTVDLGITGLQTGTGVGDLSISGTFNILQGSQNDDNLSDNQIVAAAGGGITGAQATANISNEQIYGMDGKDIIKMSGTATGGDGTDTGNVADTADHINALVTLASNILDAGAGGLNATLGGQNVSLSGTAHGANAGSTFGNHALNGYTAISAEVLITGNTLAAAGANVADKLTITAQAFGGNAGSAIWDNSTVNTGADVADGSRMVGSTVIPSEAISALADVELNHFTGGVAGAVMTIDAEATGGNSSVALYASQALNGATAISAESIVDNNTMDGHGNSSGDYLHINAVATGGVGAFTSNISGFNPDYPNVLTTPGGLAESAIVKADGNTLTEHGTAGAILEIDATANGGSGHFFGELAFDGKVISSDVAIDNNSLLGGIGDDTLIIHAIANGIQGNGYGAFNSPDVIPGGTPAAGTAIDTVIDVSGNTLNGGAGNNTLEILIDAVHTQSAKGGGGVETAEQITAHDNQMLGGVGDDVLIINNAAVLTGVNTTVAGTVLDGGAGFNTLEVLNGMNPDLTALSAGTHLNNLEKVDLVTDSAVNTLTLDDAIVSAMNTSHSLVVTGSAVDIVSSTGWGVAVATNVSAANAGDTLIADAGITFDHYHKGTADLFIEVGVHANIT
jgi:VCBS repeat-containing protein